MNFYNEKVKFCSISMSVLDSIMNGHLRLAAGLEMIIPLDRGYGIEGGYGGYKSGVLNEGIKIVRIYKLEIFISRSHGRNKPNSLF